MFTKTCQHAIRAMVFIAQREGGVYVSSLHVSESLRIPPSFLAKILQRLTAADLLVSQRGPSGGVKLARPAAQICLTEIVEAVDGHQTMDTCLFGWPDCTGSKPCPLHAAWGLAVDPVRQLMKSTSLQDTTDLLQGSLRGSRPSAPNKTDKRLKNRV